MPQINFVLADGRSKTVDAQEGLSVMEAARSNNIEAIEAECGGAMACATCHAYIDDAWADRVGPAGETEADMLDFAACEVKSTSRLSCQVKITAELDGLVVHLPEAQV